MRTTVMVFGGMPILLLSVTSIAQAQSLFIDDMVISSTASGAPADQRQLPGTVLLSKDQFDKLSGAGPIARARLTLLFNTRLAKIEEDCSLTADQHDKLLLAARGDIARLMGKAERLRTKYVDQPLPAEAFVPMQIELTRELAIPFARPFGENSLFFNVLRKSLTEQQYEQYQAFDRVEQWAEIRSVISSFFRGAQELSPTQERLIFDQIMSKYPTWHPQMIPAAYSHYVGVLVAAEMKDELKPILSNLQWQHLQSHIPAGQRLEPKLRSLGLWPIGEQAANLDRK